MKRGVKEKIEEKRGLKGNWRYEIRKETGWEGRGRVGRGRRGENEWRRGVVMMRGRMWKGRRKGWV